MTPTTYIPRYFRDYGDPPDLKTRIKKAVQWYYRQYDRLPSCIRVNGSQLVEAERALEALRLELLVVGNGGTLIGEVELGHEER